MATLNETAKAMLRAAGVTQAEWARRNWMADGKWSGDVCGCPDSGRCANGFHHDGPDDCGCLPALLERLAAGEGFFAPSLSESWDIIGAVGSLHAPLALYAPDGRHFDICAHCCCVIIAEARVRTRECEDGHRHGPGKPRCLTAHVLNGGSTDEPA